MSASSPTEVPTLILGTGTTVKSGQIPELMIRCKRAKNLLSDYVVEKAGREGTRSLLWFKMHYSIIAFYLDHALYALEQDSDKYLTTIKRELPAPPPSGGQVFIEPGMLIIEKLVGIEQMLKCYGLVPPHLIDPRVLDLCESDDETKDKPEPPPGRIHNLSSPQFSLAAPSEARKRARSMTEDSGIDLTIPGSIKRTRFVIDDDDDSADDIDTTSSPTTKQASRAPCNLTQRLASAGDKSLELTVDISCASNEEYHGPDVGTIDQDADVDADVDALKAPTRLHPHKRRGRPPKINTSVANAKRDKDFICKSPRTQNPHSGGSKRKDTSPYDPANPRELGPDEPHPIGYVWPPLQYNGRRGRPVDMPHIPCPEGVNPRVWYGMSYRRQQERMEGLLALAEMDSDKSDREG